MSCVFYTEDQQYVCVNLTLPTHPARFPPWSPHVCSLSLCVYFFLVNKIVYTIFSPNFFLMFIIYNENESY